MGLLDKLTKDGSLLTALDGKKPLEYDKVSNYPEQLSKSQLDLDGKKPLVIATDDLEGSAEIIKSLNPDFVLDPKYVSPWQTLKILSTAKCLVLANSTFSWWAGYISAEKGNSVVFPKPFYKSEPWRNDVLEFSGINPEIASFEE
jgi:hypothetical protein